MREREREREGEEGKERDKDRGWEKKARERGGVRNARRVREGVRDDGGGR